MMSDEPTELDRVLNTTEKTFSSIPAQLIALDCYSEYFGIYDNSSQNQNPYSAVCMHEPEDLSIIDSYDVYLDRFMVTGVLKYTGVTWDRFLELSREKAEALLARCDALSTKEDSAVGNILGDDKLGKVK